MFPAHHGSKDTHSDNEQTFPIHHGSKDTDGDSEQTFPTHHGFKDTHGDDEQTFPIHHGAKDTHGDNEQTNLSHILRVHRDPGCFIKVQIITGMFVNKTWQSWVDI